MRAELAAMQAGVTAGTYVHANKLSVDQACEAWLLSKYSLKPSTLTGHRVSLCALRDELGHIEVQGSRRLIWMAWWAPTTRGSRGAYSLSTVTHRPSNSLRTSTYWCPVYPWPSLLAALHTVWGAPREPCSREAMDGTIRANTHVKPHAELLRR